MRFLFTTSLVVLFVGCAAPSIDDTLATDDVKLPDRDVPPSPSGTTTGKTPPAPPEKFALTVTLAGSGAGTITSMPSGVSCIGTTCKGSFARGTSVTLQNVPANGSVFTAWSGGCTGTGACVTKMDRDITVGVENISIEGAWSGTYTNSRVASGCTFNNAGNLNVTVKAAASAFSDTATCTGLELRNIPGCGLVSTTTGSAPSAPVTVADGTLTGTWTMSVQGAGGNLPFPFTGKITGKTFAGTWTCTGCTGSFTLTKP